MNSANYLNLMHELQEFESAITFNLTSTNNLQKLMIKKQNDIEEIFNSKTQLADKKKTSANHYENLTNMKTTAPGISDFNKPRRQTPSVINELLQQLVFEEKNKKSRNNTPGNKSIRLKPHQKIKQTGERSMYRNHDIEIQNKSPDLLLKLMIEEQHGNKQITDSSAKQQVQKELYDLYEDRSTKKTIVPGTSVLQKQRQNTLAPINKLRQQLAFQEEKVENLNEALAVKSIRPKSHKKIKHEKVAINRNNDTEVQNKTPDLLLKLMIYEQHEIEEIMDSSTVQIKTEDDLYEDLTDMKTTIPGSSDLHTTKKKTLAPINKLRQQLAFQEEKVENLNEALAVKSIRPKSHKKIKHEKVAINRNNDTEVQNKTPDLLLKLMIYEQHEIEEIMDSSTQRPVQIKTEDDLLKILLI
ncbi:hypothetical protein JTE90_010631 [Oedothorax gibbosus]|uniref:Uncharacterized protein n=1 Tax=Oedothorax gibbosus TaxID=931172 RepID=A0AAV6VGB8_9ARAC|nr:hypothetical protein JTE90_010631 [Oedothorax gibbosus]